MESAFSPSKSYVFSALKNVLGKLIPAGYAHFSVNLQHDVLESSHGNAMLLCNVRVRHAACHKQSQMVFPQGQYECEVILRESVVKSDPVFPGAFPLPDHRAAVIGKFLQTALHKSAERSDDFRERRDKTVGQSDPHGVDQKTFGLVEPAETAAGNGARHPQIDVGRGDPALRRGERQRGLCDGAHGFIAADTHQVFCLQIEGVRFRLRQKRAEIFSLQPGGGHCGGNHAHGGGGKRQLRDSGCATVLLVFHKTFEISDDFRISAVISRADGRRDCRGAGSEPRRVIPSVS